MEFSSQGETKQSGLCDDAGVGVKKAHKPYLIISMVALFYHTPLLGARGWGFSAQGQGPVV